MTVRISTEAEHGSDGLGCWCDPRYLIACDECGNADQLKHLARGRGAVRVHAFPEHVRCPEVPGCWKCSHGLVELPRHDAEACDETIIVVHNR
jgi:hypothetical protein